MKSLKYLEPTTLGCIEVGIRKSELVAKTEFLYRFCAGLKICLLRNQKERARQDSSSQSNVSILQCN